MSTPTGSSFSSTARSRIRSEVQIDEATGHDGCQQGQSAK